ncbi:MAG TPA: hypothetical protein VG621_00540 [Candidatus Paceibacterota bacterium]|nr:hypothetical protein [Candidatus Paceibacterota bacterium]
MVDRIILFRACICLVVLALLNGLATEFYWYTSVFGFDKAMHTLGGITVALLGGAWFLKRSEGLSPFQTFVTLTLCTFVVGLAWEYYEYLVQFFIKGVHLADIPDSIGDLIFDIIGGAIGSFLVILIKRRYNRR